MKKIILIFICISFFFLGSVYALEDKVITVTVGEVDAPVYNVEVTWDSMEFTYNEQINYVWDNTTHTYDLKESTYYWSNPNNNVNIINKSSYEIKVKLNYKSINDDINGNFNASSANLAAKSSKNFKLMLDGELSPSNDNYIKVGTI